MRSLSFCLVAVTLATSACSSDSVGGVTVTASEPDFGSLVGGTHIVLTGSGFSAGGAAPNRVLIGGHQAALAAAIDDNHLEVEVPPGQTAGDAEIVVFNHLGQGSAMGIFHYSTAPTITNVNPSDILYTTPNTVMTLTGSGFKDENAGFLKVQIDGMDAVDVQVLSDTQVKFTALAGALLTQPNIKVIDTRGTGTIERAFRYVPSTHHGLIIFPRFGSSFLQFFDPTDQSIVGVERLNTAAVLQTTGVVRSGNDLFTVDRNNHLGKLNFRTQTFNEDPVQMSTTIISLVGVGDMVYAMQRTVFGTLELSTGAFTRISDVPRGAEIVADSTGALFMTFRDPNTNTARVSTIDKVTGVPGTAIVVANNVHFCDLRYLDGVLYGLSHNNGNNTNSLVTLDPTTGATTVLKTLDDQACAMEVFQ